MVLLISQWYLMKYGPSRAGYFVAFESGGSAKYLEMAFT